jgi:hypothetical protein
MRSIRLLAMSVLVPVLVACTPTSAHAARKGAQPSEDVAVERGQALLLEARKIDAFAAREEAHAKFARATAAQKRKVAADLREDAREAESAERDAVEAKADAADGDAAAADARAKVYDKRGKAIRARATQVRALAKKILKGERANDLAAVDLPPPPPNHPDSDAPRRLPAVSAEGKTVVLREPFSGV